ncbi:MAG: diadenylate cyclase, partial [Verrucomicrobiota bacterium]
DSHVSAELLSTLFFPNTPLHDGGVIIQRNRVVAAGCVFPLSQREELSKSLGTRHRAALGITEETDAIVIVVSEETGGISVAYNGRLSRGLDEERLTRMLSTVLLRRKVDPEKASSGKKEAKRPADEEPTEDVAADDASDETPEEKEAKTDAR